MRIKMNSLFLKPGDTIEFIAPSSKFKPEILEPIYQLMQSWNLKTKISCPVSEKEWLCTTNEKERFQVLQHALNDPLSKAIWIVWGGYGCSHLLPHLDQMPAPSSAKLIMGFSDPTILHLFVNKKWNWPSLHCPSPTQIALNKVCKTSVALLKDLIFGNLHPYYSRIFPMNSHCSQIDAPLSTCVVGGNLSLVVSSLATPWQIHTEDQCLFLEEIGEKAYRIDRMLHQLLHAGLLSKIRGLLLGDFIQKETQTTDGQTQQLLKEWSLKLSCPVFSYQAGHTPHNHPLPLNCEAQICFSSTPHIRFSMN